MKAPRPFSDAAWIAAGLALLLLWDASGLDLVVMRHLGTPAGFSWRDAWLTSTVLHQGGRWAAGLVLAVQAIDVVRPLVAGPSRAERLGALVVTLVCLLAVPALKQASATSCPWDLAEFGGAARYVPHWALGIADGGPGRCFPSGHAVAAFAFLGPFFVLRRHRRTAGLAWLAGVLAAGVLLGAAQVARGAHYPSHVLWSAWLCGLVAALSHACSKTCASARTAIARSPRCA